MMDRRRSRWRRDNINDRRKGWKGDEEEEEEETKENN